MSGFPYHLRFKLLVQNLWRTYSRRNFKKMDQSNISFIQNAGKMNGVKYRTVHEDDLLHDEQVRGEDLVLIRKK